MHVMPTRVIDVGPSDGSVHPRLHQSGGSCGQWATLSHCWGLSTTTRLTSATLAERLEGIPMESLSRNFRNAIIVSRILGIRHIWIDSLCIIQDSAEDWLRESAKMGDIYKYSLITIAATNAEDSSAGFLRNRISEVRCDLIIEYNRNIPVYIRPRIEWYCFADIVGPLTHRAWVLQERLLTARTLHFGGQQMMWQCKTKTLAEGFRDTDAVPEGQIPGADNDFPGPESTNLEDGLPEAIRGEALLRSKASYHDVEDIYDKWYRVVGEYAILKLTKNSDRLPAIAGIAKQVQLRTNDIYLAGLWKSDFRRGLHWWYGGQLSVPVRPSIPQAPSWSWAALSLPTDSPNSADSYLCATQYSRYIHYEHEVSLVNFDPCLTEHGCLGSPIGSITLRGLWTSASIATNNDGCPGRFLLSYPIPLLLYGHLGISAAGRLDIAQDEIEQADIGCLQVAKSRYFGRPKYPAENFVSALLLRRVGPKDQSPSQFVRIGLAVLFNEFDTVEGWEKRDIDVI